MKKSTIIGIIVVIVLLTVIPLISLGGKAEFGGADGEAENVIGEINPDYEPWADPVMEPASGEIESLLFALQAAIGAGVIGYFIGRTKRRSESEKTNEN
ncbi:MAG: energy-coupling factor ABC transporter substrate-binding protein [Fastidiosipilaceae bacterium]|jgi:cobalt/nickel transport protein|nr:energy-coupling factor ABC transporter substrate-binding protein [Clostridiaceae bacterium]